jgi:hypothetical protein
MQLQAFRIVFDSGQEVEVELKSRDIAKAERAGVKVDDASPVVGSYALAYVALQRMQRAGLLDFDLPSSAEALEDVADLEMVEVDDTGEGSGREAVTG